MIGVILAGGLSQRMGGGDKGLLTLGDKPLLNHVIERLEPQVDHIVLNANGDTARFSDTKLPVIEDSIDGFLGPLAGVLAGMDYAASKGKGLIVTVAADTPFFPDDLVTTLQASNTHLAMACSSNGRHPTFGLWDVALRDDLRDALNDGLRKVVQWTSKHGCVNVEFNDDPFDPFFNINTPEDMAQATRMMQEYGL